MAATQVIQLAIQLVKTNLKLLQLEITQTLFLAMQHYLTLTNFLHQVE